MSSAAKRAAQAAADLARRHVRVFGRPIEVGIVRTVKPLSVELIESALSSTDGVESFVLREDGLTLSATVRRYDQDHLLKVGDALAVIQLSSEDFLALDVITDQEVTRGIDTFAFPSDDYELVAPELGGPVAWTESHIILKVRLRDETGAVIGWIPVYDTLPGPESNAPGPP